MNQGTLVIYNCKYFLGDVKMSGYGIVLYSFKEDCIFSISTMKNLFPTLKLENQDSLINIRPTPRAVAALRRSFNVSLIYWNSRKVFLEFSDYLVDIS